MAAVARAVPRGRGSRRSLPLVIGLPFVAIAVSAGCWQLVPVDAAPMVRSAVARTPAQTGALPDLPAGALPAARLPMIGGLPTDGLLTADRDAAVSDADDAHPDRFGTRVDHRDRTAGQTRAPDRPLPSWTAAGATVAVRAAAVVAGAVSESTAVDFVVVEGARSAIAERAPPRRAG